MRAVLRYDASKDDTTVITDEGYFISKTYKKSRNISKSESSRHEITHDKEY